ncbi:hypothetical protein D3C78_1898170 [compost metagenome]
MIRRPLTVSLLANPPLRLELDPVLPPLEREPWRRRACLEGVVLPGRESVGVLMICSSWS